MKYAKRTHQGKRETNQDYVETFINQSEQLLALLCDGMGGHNAGDVASEMAVLQLGNSWRETSFFQKDTTEKWLYTAINKENKRIYDAARAFHDLDGMGTTLVSAAFLDETIIISNVGDSRAYQFYGETLELITEDHSFANELRIQGQISEEEALIHNKKNTLTRSLGVETDVPVDFFECDPSEIDYLLLCSDGLSNMVNEEEIKGILQMGTTIKEKCQLLIDKALANGGTDNVSVCLIEMNTKDTVPKVTEEGGKQYGER